MKLKMSNQPDANRIVRDLLSQISDLTLQNTILRVQTQEQEEEIQKLKQEKDSGSVQE